MNHEIPNACPHCAKGLNYGTKAGRTYFCGTFLANLSHYTGIRSDLCREREKSQKLEAEVERLKKLCEMALELAEDPVEERDLKRRIVHICSLRKDLNR